MNAMSAQLSRTVMLALAALVFAATATVSAQTRKNSSERPATTGTMCPDGTPIIMLGLECPNRLGGGEGLAQKQPGQRAERPRVTTRGSGGPYVTAPLRTPSLTLTQPAITPYIPPPISNPSAQIQQLNQSFPFNAGVGNNPVDRDSYIRQNLTR